MYHIKGSCNAESIYLCINWYNASHSGYKWWYHETKYKPHNAFKWMESMKRCNCDLHRQWDSNEDTITSGMLRKLNTTNMINNNRECNLFYTAPRRGVQLLVVNNKSNHWTLHCNDEIQWHLPGTKTTLSMRRPLVHWGKHHHNNFKQMVSAFKIQQLPRKTQMHQNQNKEDGGRPMMYTHLK